ncbi:MAG TPA: SpoIIE family protein phosphatase [bacterium]|nr:SpoIIE family protein phosphatase [bacterium]
MDLKKFIPDLTELIPFLRPHRRVFRLEVPAKEIELLTIKDFIQRVCDAAGCSSKETSSVKLAIDEACSNIVRHAYQGREDGKIILEAGIGVKDIRIAITDFGKSFDFRKIEAPDLNHYVDIGKKGGLGIFLIKKIMYKVDYRTKDGRNDLILHRRLSQAPPAAALAKGQRTLSISSRFTIMSTGLIFLLIVLLYFFLNFRNQNFILSQQRDKALSLTQAMAAQAGESVVRKDDLGLDHLIGQVVRADGGRVFDYVFVVNQDDKFLAHSDLKQVFQEYHRPRTVKPVRQGGVRVFEVKTPQGRVDEYVAPVFFKGQAVGEVHLGVDRAAVDRVLGHMRADLVEMILLFSVVIIGGLYLLSLIVIRPFRKILVGVNAVSSGDFNAKIELDTKDEFGQLATIFNDMTIKLQESQKGLVEQERLQKEMQVAQEIQHTLLPASFPQIEGYEIGATYRAAKEVGGDYYDFFWVDPTTLGIVVADVSGKGVPGSMVMTMIRTAMRMEARGNKSASSVLAQVNGHVTGDMKKGMFVTMFYIILDSRNRSINFASAGHNPMILYRSSTREVFFLKPKGFPVGIDLPEEDMFSRNMALQKIKLEKDDVLLIYTDGITEAMNIKKEQFGEKRLIQVIKDNYQLTPAELVQKLNEAIAQFTSGAEQNDDITVVAIKEKMKAETVQFKMRKRLLDLVEKKGMSVAQACRQMHVSTKVYYKYKKLFDEQGVKGLKSVRADRSIEELSNDQKDAVMALVEAHPDWSFSKIVEALRNDPENPHEVEARKVREFLKRKGIGGPALPGLPASKPARPRARRPKPAELSADERSAVERTLGQNAALGAREIVELLKKDPGAPLALDERSVRKYLKGRMVEAAVAPIDAAHPPASGAAPNEVDTP